MSKIARDVVVGCCALGAFNSCAAPMRVTVGRFVALGLLILLAGCAPQNDMRELERWVEFTKATTVGIDPEPLPEVKEYVPYEYTAEGVKDPFAIAEVFKLAEKEPVLPEIAVGGETGGPRPNPNRPREELEKYTLGSLQMVGTMRGIENPDMFALIKDPEGIVHRIREGNFLGENYGKIQRITEDRIDLRELVPDDKSGRWKERDAYLSLAQ